MGVDLGDARGCCLIFQQGTVYAPDFHAKALNTPPRLAHRRTMKDRGILPVMERARGTARVGLVPKPGGWGLSDLYQQGSAKAILPDVGGAVEVVFLNTSGGLTGGGSAVLCHDAGRGFAGDGDGADGRTGVQVHFGRGAYGVAV